MARVADYFSRKDKDNSLICEQREQSVWGDSLSKFVEENRTLQLINTGSSWRVIYT